jgi:hypothetical protein
MGKNWNIDGECPPSLIVTEITLKSIISNVLESKFLAPLALSYLHAGIELCITANLKSTIVWAPRCCNIAVAFAGYPACSASLGPVTAALQLRSDLH